MAEKGERRRMEKCSHIAKANETWWLVPRKHRRPILFRWGEWLVKLHLVYKLVHLLHFLAYFLSFPIFFSSFFNLSFYFFFSRLFAAISTKTGKYYTHICPNWSLCLLFPIQFSSVLQEAVCVHACVRACILWMCVILIHESGFAIRIYHYEIEMCTCSSVVDNVQSEFLSHSQDDFMEWHPCAI